MEAAAVRLYCARVMHFSAFHYFLAALSELRIHSSRLHSALEMDRNTATLLLLLSGTAALLTLPPAEADYGKISLHNIIAAAF